MSFSIASFVALYFLILVVNKILALSGWNIIFEFVFE